MKNNIVTPEQTYEHVLMLHSESEAQIMQQERKEQRKYAIMIRNPQDKVFLSKLLDESCQIRSDRKLSKRIKYLIGDLGIPEFFPWSDRMLLRMFKWGGYIFSPIAIPIFKKRLKLDTKNVVINEKRPCLTRHLEDRSNSQIGQNVNLLGEVVLGNAEADARFRHYLETLEQPDINYISIKLSGIYAQMHPLNFESSRPELIERLSAIYQKAVDHPYIDPNGVSHPKFINLDMEEYKDAHLTLGVFKDVLSLPQFKNLYAGIVIQAYLRDAWDFQTELLEFARQRVASGGSPLKMRLVKGANLQMESVISSLRGWENPVLGTKTEVDANYLHLLDRALEKENAQVLHVGVASHNFYTISYAQLLSTKNGVEEYVTYEMLEGMANQLWRTVKGMKHNIILYTPVVKDEHFLNAISYLVRRLDENTGPENFLSYSFDLRPGTEQWEFLKNQFERAYAMKDAMVSETARKQDRNKPYGNKGTLSVFANEPDTDFDLPQNQRWAKAIVEKWKKPAGYDPEIIPLQIGDQEKVTEKRQRYIDHNQQQSEVCVYEMSKASTEDIEQIIEIAHDDKSGWGKTSLAERTRLLHRTADLLCQKRGDLIGCMCAVTGKTITEGDVEVSEAVDFCRFYPLTMQPFEALDNTVVEAKGVVVVISPWNFPLAIPVGGVAAALSGGNRVILKPATVSAPVAWEFAKAFWEAGIPKDALQVVICDGPVPLNFLTASPKVGHIILTGGTDTAQKILKNSPLTPLSAETGGKNAIILTSSGDRDKAILNVMSSAFGNAGQKCSACSLLLVEGDVFDDPAFKDKLRDAATSIKTGFNWDIGNIVSSMITNRNEQMQHVFDNLEEGQEWLVPPRYIDEQKYILAPTILWNAKPSSFIFRTELFAPVLAVVRIDSLAHGIALVNSLNYGLTSGLQSLDEREQKKWMNSIEAGNLYINRGITGAIVNRQPFGGMKLSAFGGGIKAGGINYVGCFVQASDKTGRSIEEARQNYEKAAREEFLKPRDVNNLYGEQNIFRYLPLKKMVLRLFKGGNVEDALKVWYAAKSVGTPLTVSVDNDFEGLDRLRKERCIIREESFDSFLSTVGKWESIRTITPAPPRELFEEVARHNGYVACQKVVSDGRLELLHYVKEQSISYEYHRYGSINGIPVIA